MLPSIADAIQLYAVSYKYPHSDKMALAEICYSFSRGTTAIVGPNGAGKSTLVKLLTGLLTPTSGWINVQMPDGALLTPEELHKAVLFQEPSHLYLTIRQNITMRFERTPGEDTRIYGALEKAGLGMVVKGLVGGIDTVVGAGFGGQTDLSGGQWQRLALARLIYQDAPMIILDEPVASLDPQGERAVFRLFAELAHSKIIIFTTHRYDSIPKNTKIVVLVDGNVAESGTHEELLQHQRHYWSLYMSEALSKESVPVLANRSERRIPTMNGQTKPGTGETPLMPRSTSLKISSTLSLVPRLLTSVSSGQGNPPPTSNSFKDRALAYSTLKPPSALPTAPGTTVPESTRNAGLFTIIKRIAFLFILLLLLAATILGTLFVLARSNAKTAASINPVVGHAFFVSSQQLSERNNQGINDELIIDLQNIPSPAPNKSYYAWLLGDENQPLATPILLGPLTVSGGRVHVVYKGDSHHTNLIGITSRFLITEEDANIHPNNPSPDQSNWRYFAELPQRASSSPSTTTAMGTSTPSTSAMGSSTPTTNAMDRMNDTVLQHLRHLLADAPELTPLGLHGGLDIWLFRNTQKILEWAGSARDASDSSFVQRQVIRTLAFLDGVKYFGHDVPPGTPCLCQLPNASVAILEFDVQDQNPPGYLSQIGSHLNALTQAQGATQDKRALAAQIDQDINNMQNWLGQVHNDAKQLIYTPLGQYNSPASRSLLDDMAANALYAFIGRSDPSTGQVLGGMIQVHYTIQSLATYDITHV